MIKYFKESFYSTTAKHIKNSSARAQAVLAIHRHLSAETNIASCAVGVFPIVTTSCMLTSFTCSTSIEY